MNSQPKYQVCTKHPLTEDCSTLRYYAKSVERRGLFARKCTGLVSLDRAEQAAAKWREEGLTINIFAAYTTGVYAF
jgi:hypothetical protein